LLVVGRVWQKRPHVEFGHDGDDGRQHLAIAPRRDEQHQHRCVADRFGGELRKRPHGVDVRRHFRHDGGIFALCNRKHFSDDGVVLAFDRVWQHLRPDDGVCALIGQRLQHDGVVFAFIRQL